MRSLKKPSEAQPQNGDRHFRSRRPRRSARRARKGLRRPEEVTYPQNYRSPHSVTLDSTSSFWGVAVSGLLAGGDRPALPGEGITNRRAVYELPGEPSRILSSFTGYYRILTQGHALTLKGSPCCTSRRSPQPGGGRSTSGLKPLTCSLRSSCSAHRLKIYRLNPERA